MPISDLITMNSKPDFCLLPLTKIGSFLMVYQRGNGPNSGAYGYFPAARKLVFKNDKFDFDDPENKGIGNFKKTDMWHCSSISAINLSNKKILVIGSGGSKIWSTISNDEGKTWSDIAFLKDKGDKPRLVKSENKALLFFWGFRDDKTWGITSIESVDGQEWINKRDIIRHIYSSDDIKRATSKHADYGVLSVCSSEEDKKIFLLYRLMTGEAASLYLMVGDYKGESWSKPIKIDLEIEETTEPSIEAFEGRVIIAYQAPDKTMRYTIIDSNEIGTPVLAEIPRIPTKEEIKAIEKEEIPKVLALLRKKEITTQERQKTIVRLINIGDETCVPLLIDQLNGDYHMIVKEQAMKALGAIGDKRAVPVLIEILEKPITGDPKDEDKTDEPILRRGAICALQEIGDKSAIPILEQIVASDKEYESVREFAVIALRKIKDKAEKSNS